MSHNVYYFYRQKYFYAVTSRHRIVTHCFLCWDLKILNLLLEKMFHNTKHPMFEGNSGIFQPKPHFLKFLSLKYIFPFFVSFFFFL